jgi:hypothetical protein
MISGYCSACRNLGERTSRSRARFPVLNDAALMVAFTATCAASGSTVISPLVTAMVPDTAPSPNRCRVRKVTKEWPGSKRYRPTGGTPFRCVAAPVVVMTTSLLTVTPSAGSWGRWVELPDWRARTPRQRDASAAAAAGQAA